MSLTRKMPLSPQALVEQREKQREDLKGREVELRRTARNTFASADGKLMLDILIQMYHDGPLVGETVEKTYFNLGRRDVVSFLTGLLKEK